MGVHQFPVSFEIEAEDVRSAFNQFEAHANPQIEQARRQIQEEVQRVQQQSKSRIVQPGDVKMQNRGNVIDFNKLKTD
jgi:vacuolar-type H+-ATPase subunit E/Vma4